MNKLQTLNQMLRKPNTVKIRVTAIAPNGETKSTEADVKKNQLNTLGGTGLSGKSLYDLIKHGRCETSDWTGAKFVFEIVSPDSATVNPDVTKEVKDEKPA